MPFRSILFVPGARPDRFAKALGAGADAVCIDLEDAVAPDAKDQARSDAYAYLRERVLMPGAPALGVRINSIRTGWGMRDASDLAADRRVLADFVMTPKTAHGEEIAILAEALGAPPALGIWPVVESAQGLRHVYDIAAGPGVRGLVHGGGDLSADLGVDLMNWEALLSARAAIVAAAASADLEAIDVPHVDVRDPDGLAATSARVRGLGFTGRLCIHPNQVEAVHAAFTPGPDEVAHAQRVLDAMDAAVGGVALLDGKLIEEPIARGARRTLAAAAQGEQT